MISNFPGKTDRISTEMHPNHSENPQLTIWEIGFINTAYTALRYVWGGWVHSIHEMDMDVLQLLDEKQIHASISRILKSDKWKNIHWRYVRLKLHRLTRQPKWHRPVYYPSVRIWNGGRQDQINAIHNRAIHLALLGTKKATMLHKCQLHYTSTSQ